MDRRFGIVLLAMLGGLATAHHSIAAEQAQPQLTLQWLWYRGERVTSGGIKLSSDMRSYFNFIAPCGHGQFVLATDAEATCISANGHTLWHRRTPQLLQFQQPASLPDGSLACSAEQGQIVIITPTGRIASAKVSDAELASFCAYSPADGQLYAINYDAELIAMDRTGAVLWNVKLHMREWSAGLATPLAGGVVTSGSKGEVRSIDSNGRERWRASFRPYQIPKYTEEAGNRAWKLGRVGTHWAKSPYPLLVKPSDIAATPLCLPDGTVAVVTVSGFLGLFNSTGRLVWHCCLPVRIYPQLPDVQHETFATPVLGPSGEIYCIAGGALSCVRPYRGVSWQRSTIENADTGLGDVAWQVIPTRGDRSYFLTPLQLCALDPQGSKISEFDFTTMPIMRNGKPGYSYISYGILLDDMLIELFDDNFLAAFRM